MSIFHIAITNKTPAPSVFLPMDRPDAEKLLYDLGLDVPGTEHAMDLYTDYSGIPIEPGTDFRALNRLAQRISDMGELERETFRAWGSAQPTRPEGGKQGACSVEDALKASYHLREFEFYPGFGSDEAISEVALEGEEYSGMSDEAFAMLDRAKVGARMRERDGGVFAAGGYLIAGDITGEELPAEESMPWIEVRFRRGELDSG